MSSAKIPLNPTRNGAKLRRIFGIASKKAKKIQINMNLRLPNILHNPSADLFCTVLCAAFHLDFGRADAGLRVISLHREGEFAAQQGCHFTTGRRRRRGKGR